MLYAFLIIKRPNVLDSRKSLRCLAKDAGRKGGIQRAQRAIALHSVCGRCESFFSTPKKFSYLPGRQVIISKFSLIIFEFYGCKFTAFKR